MLYQSNPPSGGKHHDGSATKKKQCKYRLLEGGRGKKAETPRISVS